MSKRFTVQYCANWDGGGQEFDTARSAILAVYPDADVIGNQVDEYPIKVKIFNGSGGKKELLWESDQRNLFRKYSDRRQESINAIKNVMKKLQ